MCLQLGEQNQPQFWRGMLQFWVTVQRSTSKYTGNLIYSLFQIDNSDDGG